MIWNDMFAGGGGTSSGLHNVKGIQIGAALNHWQNAIKTHMINFKKAKHFWADVYEIDENILPQSDGLWASVDCSDHSAAKGGQDKSEDAYMLANELLRFILHSNPSTIVVENVRGFLRWGPLDKDGKIIPETEGEYFYKWVDLISFFYPNFDFKLLNVADFGEYTSRTRLIIIFTKEGIDITWPVPTHNKNGIDGFKKWNACKEKLDLTNEGHSIFGKRYNMNIPPQARKKPSNNSLRRYAGGIKKFHPEFHQWLVSYYGNGLNVSSIESPCPVITTKDRHQLVTACINQEKFQFVTDHIWGAQHQDIEKPLKTITTWESKSRITVKKKQFVSDSTYSTKDKNSDIEEPLNTITGQQRHQFISSMYNSNNKPESNNRSIDDPLGVITTREKHQFITSFFNSSGNPESQNQSINSPMTALTSVNKKVLTTVLKFLEGFDVKARFLSYKELASITGFPDDYKWYGSQKDIIRMIGYAVPPVLAKVIGQECINNFNNRKEK